MDTIPEQKLDPSDLDQPQENKDPLKRIIRLAVGIALVGQDALRRQLPVWEAEAASNLAESGETGRQQAEITAPSSYGDSLQTEDHLAIPWFPIEWEYRLVGLAFESPKYVQAGLNRLLAAPKAVWRATAPLRFPLDALGITGIVQNAGEDFLERIRADLEHLEEVGKAEVDLSRAVGQVAIKESLNSFLARLSENPEVQDLVQSQTSGITTEIVEEFRERAVSADTVIDGLFRRLLRREPGLPGKMEIKPHSKEKRSDEW